MTDAADRFTERVPEYERSRPGYPPAVVDVARDRLGVARDDPVVDLGSGTGLLSRVFLDAGHPVDAVEPNPEMRRAAERSLGARAGFRSVAGRAEATNLPPGVASCFIAGQAFHWFDADAARRECLRVGEPPVSALIVWNVRRTTGTAFLEAYEAFLRTWGIDYEAVASRHVGPTGLAAFFGGSSERIVVETEQLLDRDGLAGRVVSSSYMPGRGHPAYRDMLAALDVMFDREAKGGSVRITYDTRIYVGTL